jgi:tetratricopeptide (TPR) repeat protein
MIKNTVGTNTRRFLNTYNSIGKAYFMLDNFDKAEEIFNELVPLKAKIYPASHVEIAVLARDFGRLYNKTGRIKEAVQKFEEAIQVTKTEFGSQCLQLAELYYYLGKLYVDVNEPNKTKALFRNAIQLQEKYLGENHVLTIETAKELNLISTQKRTD